MSAKRKKLIDVATSLFIQKGYDATSVQDIVNECQISKGSFYNHFQSKEDLVLEIIRQSHQDRWEKVNELPIHPHQDHKDRFIQQLKAHLDHIIQHREFLQLTLHSIYKNREFRYLICKIHARDLHWLGEQIKLVYGSIAKDHVYDCVMIFIGLLYSYALHLSLLEKNEIDLDHLIHFVVQRMDTLVNSFSKDEPPLLNDESWKEILRIEQHENIYIRQQIQTQLAEIRAILSSLLLPPKQLTQITACLDTLENAFSQSSNDLPEEYLIEGLLLYLKNQKIPQFEDCVNQLITLFHKHQIA